MGMKFLVGSLPILLAVSNNNLITKAVDPVEGFAAFSLGLLAFAAPCILPMIPLYIMYISGATMEEEVERNRKTAVIRTLWFLLGSTLVYAMLGFFASVIGTFIQEYNNVVMKVLGVLVIILGLNMMGVFKFKLSLGQGKMGMPKNKASWIGAFLMGIVFAIGGTTCNLPIVASLILYAGGTSASVMKGVYTLLLYSAGMAVPFLIAALFIDQFMRWIEKSDKFMARLPFVSGIVMVIMGLLMFFNVISKIAGIL